MLGLKILNKEKVENLIKLKIKSQLFISMNNISNQTPELKKQTANQKIQVIFHKCTIIPFHKMTDKVAAPAV